MIKNYYIRVTEDKNEIVELGRQICVENAERYSTEMISRLQEKYKAYISSQEAFFKVFYSAVYCQVLYGTNIPEYVYYGFNNRSHKEKTQYITWYSRYAYMTFLNSVKDLHYLDNKYEAYELLKPYYKRDAILVADWSDYPAFCEFTHKYESIFVKPVNLELAEGAHRLVVNKDSDLREIFRLLLIEAETLKSYEINRPIIHKLILEEEITPSKAISQFNPLEMSLLRVTTIAIKDEVYFFYPCFRMMCGDGCAQCGETYSIDALIDPETGIVTTSGKNGIIGDIEYHPVSGIKIKGFVMPDWEELKEMLVSAAQKFPNLRYIGWDVVHTENGWCIVEGNTQGEFFFQLCIGHGVKDEFEKLIGFHLNMPVGLRWDAILQESEKSKR